jgi:NAD(P)-dependent dehydrogenase (short-subunit alcohol dehydrogenase family)
MHISEHCDLQSQTELVTGGSGVLGSAMARVLAQVVILNPANRLPLSSMHKGATPSGFLAYARMLWFTGWHGRD